MIMDRCEVWSLIGTIESPDPVSIVEETVVDGSCSVRKFESSEL